MCFEKKKDTDALLKELEELKNSKLIEDFILDTPERNNPKIQITILEKEKIDIELGMNYCYKVLKNDKLYESFESLLNDLSPLYTTTFILGAHL